MSILSFAYRPVPHRILVPIPIVSENISAHVVGSTRGIIRVISVQQAVDWHVTYEYIRNTRI